MLFAPATPGAAACADARQVVLRRASSCSDLLAGARGSGASAMCWTRLPIFNLAINARMISFAAFGICVLAAIGLQVSIAERARLAWLFLWLALTITALIAGSPPQHADARLRPRQCHPRGRATAARVRADARVACLSSGDRGHSWVCCSCSASPRSEGSFRRRSPRLLPTGCRIGAPSAHERRAVPHRRYWAGALSEHRHDVRPRGCARADGHVVARLAETFPAWCHRGGYGSTRSTT